MYDKIKRPLALIRQDIANLKDIETSLLLVKFFHDLKSLLSYFNIDKFEICTRNDEKNPSLKYVMSYHSKDGRSHKDTLFRNLRISSEEFKDPEYAHEFERVIFLVEKEEAEIKLITTETTLEEFMKEFDKKHTINYLKYSLESSLDEHEGSKGQTTKI